MKVIINIIVLLGTLSFSLALNSCGGEEVEKTEPVVRPVKTMVVGEGASGIRSLPGIVQAANRVEMSFRVGGPLIDFPVLPKRMLIISATSNFMKKKLFPWLIWNCARLNVMCLNQILMTQVQI